MLRRLLPSLALSATLAASVGAQAAETYQIDTTHSTIVFKIKHLNLYDFMGMFPTFEGSFVLDPGAPEASSVQLSVVAESIETHSDKRNQHLRSPDFFSVEQYPTIEFQSTAVTKNGDDSYAVTGDLTLHGVTRPVDLTVQDLGSGPDPWGNHRHAFQTTFTIKRSDHGMKWGLDSGVLSDEVTITFIAAGVRQ